MNLKGNTVLITGGGSGIGRGLAEGLQAMGNQVIIAGRRQKVLDETTGANPGMKSMLLDIEDGAGIREFGERIAAEFPALNVVIHNAGIMRPEKLLSGTEWLADAEATITTNLLGPLRLTAALLPVLLKQQAAAIMTVTSGLAFVPLHQTPTYCATKAGIHSWTQSLRYQLKDTAVQVLELVPPYVQTELMGARQASDPNAMPLKEFLAESLAILKNSPQAEEIVVERAKPQRFAEARGEYEAFFKKYNDMRAAQAGK